VRRTSGSGLGLDGGKVKPETTAPSGAVTGADVTPVCLDDLAHDEQAEPGPDVLLADRRSARVALEELGQDVGRDADAVILDDDLAPSILERDAHRDAPVGRRELDGVGEQVGHHLLQPAAIAQHAGLSRRRLDLDAPLAVLDERGPDRRKIARVGSERRRGVRAAEMIERRGEAVPILRLHELFGLPAGPDSERGRKAIIVRRNGEPFAFAVDRMLGQQEVVVRPIVDSWVQVDGVSGTTDLGDGRPTLVLDLAALGGKLAAEWARVPA
jgi:hypothetical protein